MKKILLLGSRGFIGSYVNKELLALKKYKVVAPDKKEFDLLRKETLVQNEYDIIIYCAGKPRGSIEKNDLDRFAKENTQMVENVSRLFSEKNPMFVFLSSLEVYGRAEKISDTTREDPQNKYSIHKLIEENIIKKNFEKACILRLPGVYGEGQSHGFLYELSHCAKNNKKLKICNDGDVKRSFLWVGDIARIMLMIIEKSITGSYLVSGDENKKLIEYVKIYEKIYRCTICLESFQDKTQHDIQIQSNLKFSYTSYEDVLIKI